MCRCRRPMARRIASSEGEVERAFGKEVVCLVGPTATATATAATRLSPVGNGHRGRRPRGRARRTWRSGPIMDVLLVRVTRGGSASTQLIPCPTTEVKCGAPPVLQPPTAIAPHLFGVAVSMRTFSGQQRGTTAFGTTCPTPSASRCLPPSQSPQPMLPWLLVPGIVRHPS